VILYILLCGVPPFWAGKLFATHAIKISTCLEFSCFPLSNMVFSAQKLKQESSGRFYGANLILNLNPGLVSLIVPKILSVVCLLVILERDIVLMRFSVSPPLISLGQ
jgi:hypothetical protein